jgi:hypothetical protein
VAARNHAPVPARRAKQTWPALLLGLALAACATSPKPVQRTPDKPTQLHYHIAIDRDFERLTAELCFEGSLAGGLIPGHAEAFGRLVRATWLGPGGTPGSVLRSQDGLLQVPESLGPGCLRYELSLHEGGSLGTLIEHVHGQLVTGVPGWLWRPRRRPETLRADLQFGLPEGMQVSVPFARAGSTYELDSAALAFDSYAAFGSFSTLTVEAAGATASLAVLGEMPALEPAALERWLRAALQIAAQSDGRFPTRRLQLLLIPQKLGSEPFGNVARGGGASVLLLVPERFDAPTLARDWVLPHELSHLLLPFLTREDAWLSEGFATYYQEVLRARGGAIDARDALSNLARELRAARHEGTGRTLCEESRAMSRSHAYRAVYWGGAGHWLQVDLALRAASQGRQSLDALLSQLRKEARLTPPYTARELLTRLDQLSHTQLFSALLAQCERAPFPEVEPSLEALGVSRDGSLSEEAAAEARRSALFAPQPTK